MSPFEHNDKEIAKERSLHEKLIEANRLKLSEEFECSCFMHCYKLKGTEFVVFNLNRGKGELITCPPVLWFKANDFDPVATYFRSQI